MAILKVANIHFDVNGTTLIRANGANTLTINTSGSEDVRVDPNGNVGIGTVNPTYKLHVVGSGLFSTGLTVGSINVEPTVISSFVQANAAYEQANTATTNANLAYIQANTATTVAQAAFGKANATTYTSNVVISVTDNTNAALRITQTGLGNALLVEDSANPDTSVFKIDANGKVGIGTSSTSGTYKLSVITGTSGPEGIQIGGSFGTILMHPSANAGDYNPIVSANDQTIIFYDAGGLNSGNLILAPYSSTTSGVKIDQSGNLIIGRTDTTVGLGVKLDVNGAINASAIYVNGAAQQSGAATYSANVGNNSANTFNVAHSLNKQFVIPAVRENSTGYYVYPDIKYTSANTIVLEFINAPTTNQYTVIVLG